MVLMDNVSKVAEEILDLVVKNGKVELSAIYDSCNATKETTDVVIDFLVDFGFLEFDKKRRYLRLSNASRRFFK